MSCFFVVSLYKSINMKVGSKIILKDNLGFENQMERNNYNNSKVTVKEIWYKGKSKIIDTFFIEEDNGYFEWTLEDVNFI